MPLGADSIVQETTGSTSTSVAASTGLAITLPSGTTAGNTVIAVLAIGSGSGATLPTGWVLDGSSGLMRIARKSNVTAGETSWTFSSPGAGQWAWYVCEVAGLDPTDDVVDVTASYTDTGAVASPRTVPTGTTGINPGADTLVIGGLAAKVGTGLSDAGTWGSYTAGYDEAGQASSTGTGAAPVSVAAIRHFSGGAAFGPFSAQGTVTWTGGGTAGANGAVVAYRAVDSPMVSQLTTMLGFEDGSHYGMGSTVTGRSIATVTGTLGTSVVVQAASARSAPSGYGCQLTAASSIVNVGPTFTSVTGGRYGVAGFDLRVVSGSGIVIAAEMRPTQGTALQLVYDVTNTRYGLRWGAAGTVSWQSGTTPLNTWVWVDLAFTGVTTSTWHADWRLETAANTYSPQSSPADLTGQATAILVGSLFIGAAATAQTVTMDVDNIVVSIYAASYPLGPHVIRPVKVDPAGTPTVNGTVGNFALVTSNATGAALTTGTLTSARDAIDDLPPTISAASDGVVQTTTAASDYLQFPMDTFTVASTDVIGGVRAYACYISTTGAGAGDLSFRGWDGTTETALVALSQKTPGSSTTLSNAVPPWGAYMWNLAGAWTQAKLDAAALRLGFSTDATPDMGVHAMFLEVATRAAVTARQLSVEADVFTVDVVLSPYTSASVSYVLTSNDATRGATFSYSVGGVAQTPVHVAASSSTTISVAADAFGDVNPDSLEPDA